MAELRSESERDRAATFRANGRPSAAAVHGLRAAAVVVAVLLTATSAFGQLRVVNYNIAQLRGTLDALENVLAEMHDDDTSGFAAPVSVFIFQEVRFADLPVLADLIDAGAPPGVVYAQGTYTNFNKDPFAGAQAMFYRANLLTEDATAHEDIFTGAGRYADRWRLRLLGYDSPLAAFYIYSAHLKASSGGSNEQIRLTGVQAIRDNADALPPETHIIYSGDMNFYHNGEPGYLYFLSAGNGSALDPLGSGSWNGPGNAIKHTQSPRLIQADGLTGGGLDDRFDFQLSTDAFQDDAGLALIDATYRALGNDGLHYNDAINAGNNFYFPGDVARSNALADDLHDASDHVPVVADYQIPARMLAMVSPSDFGRVIQGAEITIGYSVINNAPQVTTPLGADVLSFIAQGSGVVLGQQAGTAEALMGPTSGSLPVGTSFVGDASGAITFNSTNQAVQNGTIAREVSGTIVRPSNPSFAPVDIETELTIDIELDPDSGVHVVDLPIHNVGFDAFQALLDVDDMQGLTAPFALSGGLPADIDESPGAVSIAIETAGLADDLYTADLIIMTSDEDLPGETTSALLATINVTVGDAVPCEPDLNDDGLVNVLDLLAVLSAWGDCPAKEPCAADLNDDGLVNVLDLLELLSAWGLCP